MFHYLSLLPLTLSQYIAANHSKNVFSEMTAFPTFRSLYWTTSSWDEGVQFVVPMQESDRVLISWMKLVTDIITNDLPQFLSF